MSYIFVHWCDYYMTKTQPIVFTECDLGPSLKFSRPWETEGEESKVWSGNVAEKSLVVVKKEWLGQSRDLITHWWQLIIKERRED